MTIWPNTYKSAHAAGTRDGGAVSVALKTGTTQIWFRRSPDGESWPATAPFAPVLVGDLGGSSSKNAQVQQRRDGALLVTNGFDIVWISKDGGRTWAAY